MRSTSVKVLPEPGPAMMSSGPSVVVMAWVWAGLAVVVKGDICTFYISVILPMHPLHIGRFLWLSR